MAESELLRLSLPCDCHAPGHARQALWRLDAVEPVRDDAVLLASELVSSAVVERGVCSREETIEFVASRGPHGVQLAVAAAAAAEDSPPRPAPIMASVIDALTRRWGIECGGGRARLWAELGA